MRRSVRLATSSVVTLGGRYAIAYAHQLLERRDTSWLTAGSDIKFTQDLISKKFSWKAGVNYQASNTILFYASAANRLQHCQA